MLYLAPVVVPLAGFEAYLRLAYTCDPASSRYPTVFVPGIGNLYRPGQIVRDTNRFDYCVEERTNSLGFLDAEPPAWEAAKDKLRIALIGDSLVEASQVPLADKTQTWLARDLKTAFGRDASVAAFGFSGLGQVQELALFEKFAAPLHPDIVVLMVIRNDLKNNSWLLQAIEDRVSPDTPYYPAIRPAASADSDGDGGWVSLAPVPNDRIVHLPAAPPAPPLPRWLAWLARHSLLYAYLEPEENVYLAPLYRWLAGAPSHDDRVLAHAVAQLSQHPVLAPLLAGWPRYEDGSYLDTETAFEVAPRPPAFDLAIRATEHALDRWVALSRQQHFKIVAMLRWNFVNLPRQAELWRGLLAARGIPVIAEAEFLKAKGYAAADEHFRHDSHLSPAGHRWTAEALTEFLREHPDYLAATAARVKTGGSR